MTSHHSPTRRVFLLIAAAAVALAACSGAAPSSSTPPTVGPTPTPIATIDPGGGVVGGGGDVGSGGGVVVGPTPVDPGAGQPAIVIPKPGQKNPHPVRPMTIQASVDGRHVLVKVSWYSGVEPCNVLDSVNVVRSGTDIAISLMEGSSDLAVACIEIAQLKATIVDLGDLLPGTYTISAPNSEAPPVQITIS
ncbi:MAG: hypothetical protein QOI09_1669 [Chloroflexota bacterium]|jgi:hypothetical protein|nr:hypothetical protein [Chloroflexota bacterium]